MIREFHLSPPGKGGVSCDADGAFIGAVPVLNRLRKDGNDAWQPRDCEELSEQLGEYYGLPIDMSAKKGGLKAIANALNNGNVARAQIATVLLGVPDPPQLSKRACSRDEMIEFVGDLHWSGMLKWDPDEHPRWPAGSSEGKGGEFAPKGEGGEPGASLALQSDAVDRANFYDSRPATGDRSARIQLADVGVSDASDDPVDNNLYTDDIGIYAVYGNHIGGVQFASAAIPMGPLGITRANLANWADLTRLADGSLELGSGQIITAAGLLSALDQSRERDAVRSAVAKFGLNPTQAADVLAARAYVWAQTAAPWNFAGVPQSGAQLESVSKSIMLVELARPGTLYLAWQGDRLSTTYLNMAAQEGLSDAVALESRIRLANAAAALQTTSMSARAALKLQPNDRMQAHHLVPVNIIADNLGLATLASKAGWRTDSLDNLIELPADPETQEKLALTGRVLPIQSSAHPVYDAQTQKQIEFQKMRYGDTLTPLDARAILELVATTNRALIESGVWLPRLR